MSGHISDGKIVVIETGRRWSDEERKQAVEATQTSPVSAVARKFGMAKSLLFRWRKEAGLSRKRRPVAPFVPVRIAAAPTLMMNIPTSATPAAAASASATPEVGTIEIEFSDGIRLRVNGTVKPESLRQVIAALRG